MTAGTCPFCRKTVGLRKGGELRAHVRTGTELCPASGIQPDEPVCRVCGCSMFRPCDEGCWWVPDPAIAVGGNVCSRCAPVINPLESWDGHVPCPTCMGTTAHQCPDRSTHDTVDGRVRAVYEPPAVYA